MTANTGRVALALDELLCKLTTEQIAALNATAPVWMRDQVTAAVQQIDGGIAEAQRAGIMGECVGMPTADCPEWVRLGLTDTFATWWLGRQDSCMHAPHPMRPQPVFAAAWRPGLIICGRCSHLLDIPRNSAKDRTCDGCGRVVAGVDHGDPMYPFSVNAGVLSYWVGACDDCRFWGTS